MFDVDHPVPLVNLQKFEQGLRHQSGIVDHHVDAPVRLHCLVYKTLDLFAVGHVGLNDSVVAQRNDRSAVVRTYRNPAMLAKVAGIEPQ